MTRWRAKHNRLKTVRKQRERTRMPVIKQTLRPQKPLLRHHLIGGLSLKGKKELLHQKASDWKIFTNTCQKGFGSLRLSTACRLFSATQFLQISGIWTLPVSAVDEPTDPQHMSLRVEGHKERRPLGYFEFRFPLLAAEPLVVLFSAQWHFDLVENASGAKEQKRGIFQSACFCFPPLKSFFGKVQRRLPMQF